MRKFFVLTMLIITMIAYFAISTAESCHGPENDHCPKASGDSNETASLGGLSSSFIGQKYRWRMTCNIYPRVCRIAGSPGPDCCKKQCVDIMKDKWNCGKCGRRCKYSEVCCKGKCVNPMFDKKNCGGCFRKCKKGSSCVYGMCSYA